MEPTPRFFVLAGLALSAAGLAGCASEVVLTPSSAPAAGMAMGGDTAISSPGIEAQDIVTVADKMARNILGVARIANAKATPRIVLEPVANRTNIAIDRDVFLARIRILLNQKAMNRVRFLDQAMMANLERGQPPKPAADPDLVAFRGADYFLSGQFEPLTPAGTGGSVLYHFRLRDAHTGEVVWEGSYEIGDDNLASPVAFAS
jgi:hypothetical protein